MTDNIRKYIDAVGVNSHVDWKNRSFCGVAFDDLGQLDFRKKRGRNLKSQCSELTTKRLKKLTSALFMFAQQLASVPSYDVSQLDAVLRVQAVINGWWVRHTIRQKGIVYYCRHRSNNLHDPITLEKLENIAPVFFFSFAHLSTCYAMDIRNLYQLMGQHRPNPFNSAPFDLSLQERVFARIHRIEDFGRSTDVDKDPEPVLPAAKIRLRVIRIFQLIDGLDHYTNVQWFFDLTAQQLKMWYISAEDTWNYRAQLTPLQQKVIVPDGISHPLFRYKQAIKNMTDHIQLQNIVLDVMERWVTSGITRADRVLGAMYVLSALTECSPTVAETLPWLYQPPS
jgi:hypothetical protein